MLQFDVTCAPLQMLSFTMSVYESRGFGDYKILRVGCYIVLWLFLKHANLLQSIVTRKKGCSKPSPFWGTTATGLTPVGLTPSKGSSIPGWVSQWQRSAPARLFRGSTCSKAPAQNTRLERGVCIVSTGFVGPSGRAVFLSAVAEPDLPESSIHLWNLSFVGQVWELITTEFGDVELTG